MIFDLIYGFLRANKPYKGSRYGWPKYVEDAIKPFDPTQREDTSEQSPKNHSRKPKPNTAGVRPRRGGRLVRRKYEQQSR